MSNGNAASDIAGPFWLTVQADASGQFTAQAVGLPRICATAPTRDGAVRRAKSMLAAMIQSGELEPVEIPMGTQLKWFGHADPNDPDEQFYLQELARMKQEDLEETLRELDKECSNSSSTPTT